MVKDNLPQIYLIIGRVKIIGSLKPKQPMKINFKPDALSFQKKRQAELLCFVFRSLLMSDQIQVAQQFSMLFEEENPQDKGLFTFYREQAEKEQEMKRNKRQRRELKKKQLPMPLDQPLCISTEKELSPIKTNTVKKVYSVKQDLLKVKPAVQKKRLIQSVVDMSKHMQDENDKSLEKQSSGLRLKEPIFIAKSRKYRQRVNQIEYSFEHQKSLQNQDIAAEIRVESLQRRNQSNESSASRLKAAIHTNRGSVELPDIRKQEEHKPQYKPKKSIKSRMLQQALMMKDRDKIRRIRQNLTNNSFNEHQNEQEPKNGQQDSYSDYKNFQIFQFQQQNLLFALRRVKRRL